VQTGREGDVEAVEDENGQEYLLEKEVAKLP
jgi:hypothetical protein